MKFVEDPLKLQLLSSLRKFGRGVGDWDVIIAKEKKGKLLGHRLIDLKCLTLGVLSSS